MNMIVTPASPATPNGTTRPQVRIVIVGHVDHGKSTLVGRLLHETGSLPDGKLEMLKAVSARRGMPFEWSFLLDALQTERDQWHHHRHHADPLSHQFARHRADRRARPR